jgi:hypothetical protein
MKKDGLDFRLGVSLPVLAHVARLYEEKLLAWVKKHLIPFLQPMSLPRVRTTLDAVQMESLNFIFLMMIF